MVEGFQQAHLHKLTLNSVCRSEDASYLLGDDHVISNTILWCATVSCNAHK